METDLGGKVAFITGAAGAIGSAMARLLAGNGAAVVVADVNGDGARAVAASLPHAIAVEFDIRDREAAEAAVEACTAAFGRLDILINNAGVNTLDHRVDIDAFPHAEWDRIVGIDLDGTFVMSRAALPLMVRGGGGRIVNIASVVGLAALRLQSPFVAAKAGIIHLTRSMALELAPKGVLVNAIAPGSVVTELTSRLFYDEDGQFGARAAAFMAHVPLGRPGAPEEIAQAALFLCAPENSYVNGHILTVDGGWTAGYMM
jgi:3-oxoacyl-[acyl-carrier protein] reductase/2-deoxy-D-gluconate 3-dehydrogenase